MTNKAVTLTKTIMEFISFQGLHYNSSFSILIMQLEKKSFCENPLAEIIVSL